MPIKSGGCGPMDRMAGEGEGEGVLWYLTRLNFVKLPWILHYYLSKKCSNLKLD